ncbi:MAG: hypothetical protein RLZZ247_455, partial [Cyanobacteriota bacterium]
MQQRRQAAEPQHHERERTEQRQQPEPQWAAAIHGPIAVIGLKEMPALHAEPRYCAPIARLTYPMTRTIAVSGASGKTGYRIAEELLRVCEQPRLLLRPESVVPASLEQCEQHRLQLGDRAALDAALSGCDGLVIATGARPSVDLSGPMRVDAWGVRHQVESCERLGIRRVVLVSSLCAGRWRHPLNLFGLILVWKRIGEQSLERSSLEWTVIRPGGLSEREAELDQEG